MVNRARANTSAGPAVGIGQPNQPKPASGRPECCKLNIEGHLRVMGRSLTGWAAGQGREKADTEGGW
eukprot:scaffold19494_cov82-Isochrysis_galbana.AAC.1